MKTTFKYQSRFAKILEVRVLHEFYTNRIYNNVTFLPTPESAALIKNYQMLFRSLSNGFVLLYNRNSKVNSPVFDGPLDLQIDMDFTDNLFINFTEIPYAQNQMLSFKNNLPNSNLLHKGNFVDQSNAKESDQAGITGRIVLSINENNEIFGIDTLDKELETKFYNINFDSRSVIVRYNFYFTVTKPDFSNYFIVDSKNQNKRTQFNQRTLANGMEVFTMELENTFKLKDRYDEVYYLKKEDEFYKSFSKSLPQPNPRNFSFDSDRSTFLSDIYIKLD